MLLCTELGGVQEKEHDEGQKMHSYESKVECFRLVKTKQNNEICRNNTYDDK